MKEGLALLSSLVCGTTRVSCSFSREGVGVEFQEELSDMLLLKMLQAASRAAADKDRVCACPTYRFAVRFGQK